ncbi:hypothetical protein B9R42_10160 [Arthrospira platensis PCC 7345]|nr:MAG: hypothetical protein EA414_04125 [Arthrospira sp. PLM2.Bin9]
MGFSKIKHSRHRALGDSKRTQSEGKTTSVAHCCEASRNPRSFRTRRYVNKRDRKRRIYDAASYPYRSMSDSD